MTFVFPLLLGGLALAAAPILLHLIARDKPRVLPFPAFRFLVQKHRTNQRKLRLRHLLLLLLRMGLIVALCLALARPRLFQDSLGLSVERPADVVLVFDTSASMEYESSDGRTRLEEGKRRALELLDELPEGSRAVVIDVADPRTLPRESWLSLGQARQQIGLLKIRYDSPPISAALESALMFLADEPLADASAFPRARIFAVFTDRTQGSWDGAKSPRLLEKFDRLPPRPEGLDALRGRLSATVDQLRTLRADVPPTAGRDYNDQALIDALSGIQDSLATRNAEAFATDESLRKALANIRKQTRDLARTLNGVEPTNDLRTRHQSNLQAVLRATEGAMPILFDVRVPEASDLAIVSVNLPRTTNEKSAEWFREGQGIPFEVVLRSIGKDRDATLLYQLGEAKQRVAVELKANQTLALNLEFDAKQTKLGPGVHPLEVRFEGAGDMLTWNDRQTLAIGVRPKSRVLVLADEPELAQDFLRALTLLGFADEFRSAGAFGPAPDADVKAAVLLGVAKPSAELWGKLEAFVERGGGLAIFPPGDSLDAKSYQGAAATRLLPATWKDKQGPFDPLLPWNFDQPGLFAHPFLQPFEAWRKSGKVDFFVYPRGVRYYWMVEPTRDARTIVAYSDNAPAVLERSVGKQNGKVLLFTTHLDGNAKAWNDYAETLTSFYLALTLQTTRTLVGSSDSPAINFQLGQVEPKIAIRPANQARQATLRGPDTFESFTLAPGQAEFVWKYPRRPGFFTLEDAVDKQEAMVGRFALQMPAEESNLTPIPDVELYDLFGPDGVLALDRAASIKDALQSRRSEPIELFPYLMIALLLLLAIENWWSNRFYPKESA